jgi:AraC family transcriptional regulator
MLTVLPFAGVEKLADGAFVMPASTVSTLASGRSRWEGAALETFECVPGCSVPEHCHPVHFITLQTGGYVRTEWTSGGRMRYADQAPGTVCIMPKGSLHRHQWSDTSSRIVVTLDSATIARATDDLAHREEPEIIERWNLRDPQIETLMIALHLDAKAGHPAGALYGETLATALAVYLLRTQGVTRGTLPPPRGGLPSHRLNRVREFVDANLGRELRLSELASVADMSAHYFSELFRRSTGLSPHQFVLRERIRRAKTMLLASAATMADVAIATGFPDQSHFAKMFRKLVGVAPRDYRNAARSSGFRKI